MPFVTKSALRTAAQNIRLQKSYRSVDEILNEEVATVYIDWIDDAQFDRTAVSPKTANQLRNRMKQCKSLIYAHTANTSVSTWCPWELGYFDALKNRVFILPIVDNSTDSFPKQEYIGLYPYISEEFSELKVRYINETASTSLKKAIGG
jgi:hypothetical protein